MMMVPFSSQLSNYGLQIDEYQVLHTQQPRRVIITPFCSEIAANEGNMLLPSH